MARRRRTPKTTNSRKRQKKDADEELDTGTATESDSNPKSASPSFCLPEARNPPIVVEISSSQQESMKSSQHKDEKHSAMSKPEVASTKDKVGLEKDDQLNTTVEELKRIVHALTTFIVTQTPNAMPLVSSISQTLTSSGAVGEKTPATVSLDDLKELAPKLENTMNRVGVGRKLFTLNNDVETPGKITESTPYGYYINYHSSSTLHNPPRLIGSDIPDWMHGVFRPTQDMILNDIDVAVAAYIFGIMENDESDGKEILITPDAKLCNGKRSALKTLLPKGLVDQDVLNLLACMLTYEDRSWTRYSSIWFLPTTFSQFALSWTKPPTTLMEYYKKKFMGKVDYVTKIFVPINEDNMHWYLLVIDLTQRQLILLDSKPSSSKHDSRKKSINFLALYIEEMLQHDSFYDFHTIKKPLISKYKIVEPEELNEQKDGSNDCGVWVATWMRECKFSSTYNIKVHAETRLRLALDLVLNPYNKLKEKVIRKAFRNMIKHKQKHERLVRT